MTDERSSDIALDPALARRIEELSPTKRALLEQQLRARAIRRGAIPPRALGAPTPASFGQELLWRLDNATPGLFAYNVARAMRLVGRIDAVALQRAVDLMVARHAALRTRFTEDGGDVTQVIDPPAPVAIEHVDLGETVATGSTEALGRIIGERVRGSFDLAHEGQFRVILVRVATDEHVLLWVSHHIALDGWSASLLLREFASAYDAFARGAEPVLADPPITFADFAAWQREWLSGERLEQLMGFWRQRLEGAPELLPLPTDWPRPQTQHFDGAQATVMLPPELVQRVRDLAQRTGVTPYMVLLATYMTLLARYTGEDDILIGSPIAGRTRPETEGVVGYFANTLVHRADLSGDPTFAQLLERVRVACIGAFEHQEVPLEKLVMELRRDRQASHAPLFQCALTMEDAHTGIVSAGALRIEPLELDSSYAGAAKFDLLVLAREHEGGIRLLLEYRTDLFRADSAQRIVGHFRELLRAATDDPDRTLSALTILTAGERAQLDAWSPAPIVTSTPLLLERFLGHAERDPGAIAVRCSGETASYAEVRARAFAIGSVLEARGVARGDRVGIALPRSIDAVAAVLGVMLHGCAYVPIALDLPTARVGRQIQDADVQVVLVSATANQDAYVARKGAPIVVDEIAALRDGSAFTAKKPAPEDIAYVLFTSGSTGAPKGVAVTHGNAASYADAIVRRLDIPSHAQWSFATVSTLAADLGNTSIFAALSTGGSIDVVPESVASDGVRFAEHVAAHPVDVLKITPSHLRALMSATPEGVRALLPRAWVVLGGEALDWSLAQHLMTVGTCRVLNHYGPTEATVGAAAFEVTADSARTAREAGAQTVPIGAPLAHATLHVLDRAGASVPVGVPGELYIAGSGVASGYVARAELTSERFVTLREEGVRAYRTGDRVRRLPNGALEFLGRTDGQVKVRGFRVETAEIEAVLARHPSVAAAAVLLAQEDTAGAEPALAAFVVLRAGDYAAAHATRPDAGALREWMATELPDYMVPTSIETLDAIPLNANGKRDLAALRERAARRESVPTAHAYVAPRSDTEAALSAIWAEVFKREHVGVTDNFLSLGGQSLLAIRVLGKMSRHFGVRLPLRSLFDAPTIEQLAALVDGAVAASRPVQTLQ